MQIEEVITEAVLAVYSVPELAKHVYLKGGAALRLLDELKLSHVSFRGEPLEIRRRNALVPVGTKKSTIPLDISDHEYCGKGRRKVIGGVEVHGYTRELLVLEKLLAICQQHPDYPYSKDKNRARDFYDILQLSQNADETFLENCRQEIGKVFAAKEVALIFLKDLWDDDFTEIFACGFDEVRETVQGTPYPFETYLEHTRFLVEDLVKDIRTA